MEKLRIGLIGVGNRGSSLLRDALVPQENAVVTAVCDLYPDRVQDALDYLKEKGYEATGFADYRELLASGLVDTVVVATSWEAHVPVSCAAMEARIPTGCEVGGAYSIEDCYRLIRTQEATGTPFMLLENCNYDRNETCLFAMVEAGVFGKIVAVDGGYMHDLRDEVAGGDRLRHYRLRNYQMRNGENYPTHELCPLAKMLNINRGNRMVSLVSVASAAYGLNDYMERKEPDNPHIRDRFAQGDIVTTIITCAGGETITLRLDTTLPRYYSRGINIHGTKALYTEDNNALYIDGEHNRYHWGDASPLWNNFKEYSKPYRNADWQAVDNGLVVQGHGGMDYFMVRDFVDHIREGRPLTTDVYDAASMMCITPLSEQSIRMGGMPVDIPDFTGGAWLIRK